MKKNFFLILIAIVVSALWTFAQEAHKVVYSGKSYMGDKQTQSGTITKDQFDKLIKMPLIAIDNNGKEWRVTDFTFTYAERALYQDTLGNPLITTDYFTTSCPDGKLGDDWIKNITERSKVGDTAYFDRITTVDSTSSRPRLFITEPIKLVIIK